MRPKTPFLENKGPFWVDIGGGPTEGTHWDRRMFPVAVEVALCAAVLGVKGVCGLTSGVLNMSREKGLTIIKNWKRVSYATHFIFWSN